jgi:membrane protein DedA with SNARE-associated domain
MDGQVITQFLSQYGYIILLPLMIIEGPIVTLIAAFMASMRIFDIRIILILSILGDMIGDLLYYSIGHKWGMKFVEHIGKYIGITRKLVSRMEKFFALHGGKTVFIAKATTGLCGVTFVTAGIVKMPLKKFITFSFSGGILWSSFLVAMGYFFGYFYTQIEQYIEYAGSVIFGIAVCVFIIINIVKKHETEEIFEDVVK